VEGTEAEQEIAHRALAYAARLLTDAGVTVIVDATAPRRAWREAARRLIPCFAEVQLVCPAEICLEREQAARWGRFREPEAGRAPSLAPDIVLDYEESLRPELVLRTDAPDLWSAVEQVLWLVRRLRRAAAAHLQQP
jgi:adenylylsulfate kinase